MPELRQNLATGEWVVFSPERLKGKPLQKDLNKLMDSYSSYEKDCPFCPENENRFIHKEISKIKSREKKFRWQVRCIENKYKIFDYYDVTSNEFYTRGIYKNSPANGSHELILEHPIHNKTFATMTQNEVESVIKLYLQRFNFHKESDNKLLTIIFKNHGPGSGASQFHPHSQIVSLGVVPNYIRFLIDGAMRYFDSNGICVFCKMIEYEQENKERIVYENDRFISIVPYAAMSPYEIHIFPKTHDALFGDMKQEEITYFSDCLRKSMMKLYNVLHNPDYNLLLRNPPYPLSGVPFYHWHIQVVPHLSTPGGFELGSRINVNVVMPEHAAKQLQESAET